MSDPNRDAEPNENENENESEATPSEAPKPARRGGVAPPNPTQRDSDRVARPGFRNPPNTRSKAQKNKKGKKK